LLQQPELESLASELTEFFIEVETNGTVMPSDTLRVRVGQWNVSPKLANSAMPLAQRRKPAVLESFRDTERAWLKFVIGEPSDMDEVRELVTAVGWPAERVMLMPEARTPAELEERSPAVAKVALDGGFRFSTRLHVLLWGDTRGR
jgi:organic radical activating enzyme